MQQTHDSSAHIRVNLLHSYTHTAVNVCMQMLQHITHIVRHITHVLQHITHILHHITHTLHILHETSNEITKLYTYIQKIIINIKI